MKIFIKTYGCSLNSADSESMAGLLLDDEIVYSEDEADLIIINSCVVKDKTEGQLFAYIEKHKDKKLVVTGCGAQAMPEKFKDYSLVGVEQLDRIIEAVNSTEKGDIIQFLGRGDKARLSLPAARKNKVIEIVPINTGCLGACSYCLTKKARGILRSYPVKEICTKIKQGIVDGIREFWLTSPDTAAYGIDLGKSLPELLEEVCKIDGEFFVRLGMGNPDHFSKYTEELIEAMKHPKMFKFIHIPVQAGDDDILKAMRRGYTAETYYELIAQINRSTPDMTFSTDVIVGFPGETEEQFQKTIELMKETRPQIMNISRFAPRPGTEAAGMKNQISSNDKKKRSITMTGVHQEISEDENKKWLGWKGRILIDEKGKDNTWIGRNQFYKPIVIEGKYDLGDWVKVEIVETGQCYFKAKPSNP